MNGEMRLLFKELFVAEFVSFGHGRHLAFRVVENNSATFESLCLFIFHSCFYVPQMLYFDV